MNMPCLRVPAELVDHSQADRERRRNTPEGCELESGVSTSLPLAVAEVALCFACRCAN